MTNLRRLVAFAFACSLCLTAPGCWSTRSRVPGVTVSPGRNTPQVAVEIYPKRMVLDVESPQGIGSATIAMSGKVHPKHLTLRLHLRGLEELCFTYQDCTVVVSMASSGSREVRERLRVNGAERTLAPDDPHWMPLRPVGGATTTPSQSDGVIEVDAPWDFAKSGARSFNIEWVDFFR